jgi:hypothetical protein
VLLNPYCVWLLCVNSVVNMVARLWKDGGNTVVGWWKLCGSTVLLSALLCPVVVSARDIVGITDGAVQPGANKTVTRACQTLVFGG